MCKYVRDAWVCKKKLKLNNMCFKELNNIQQKIAKSFILLFASLHKMMVAINNLNELHVYLIIWGNRNVHFIMDIRFLKQGMPKP